MDTANSHEAYVETVQANVKEEMNAASKTSNLDIKVHKDPLNETTKYLFKNDVYDIFKVINGFKFYPFISYLPYEKKNIINLKSLTVNLVLNEPKDPIRSMIDNLKEIQQAENLNKVNFYRFQKQ